MSLVDLNLDTLERLWAFLPEASQYRLRVTCKAMRSAGNILCKRLTLLIRGYSFQTAAFAVVMPLVRSLANLQEVRILDPSGYSVSYFQKQNGDIRVCPMQYSDRFHVEKEAVVDGDYLVFHDLQPIERADLIHAFVAP